MSDVAAFLKGCSVNEFVLQGGEPLIMTGCIEFIDWLAQRHDPKLTLLTNGVSMRGARLDLIAGACRRIIVSINAATRSTYATVMGYDLFETVVKNVKRAASRSRSTQPEIEVHMTIVPENVLEVGMFLSLASDLGADRISFCSDCRTDSTPVAIDVDSAIACQLRADLASFLHGVGDRPHIDPASARHLAVLLRLEETSGELWGALCREGLESGDAHV